MEFESTEHERVYRAMRANVGTGGSAVNEAGIDGLWRWARAKWIARATAKGELVALQAFPHLATEALPYYERLFALAPGDSVADRQVMAARFYALQFASDIPNLTRALQQIDERFTIIAPAPELSVTTQAARAFEDYAGELPMGSRQSTAWPNYSTDFEVYVVLELGGGVLPDADERARLTAAKRLLHDVLPAHNMPHVVTHRGFTLDVDRLDLTSFGG